jgi:mRNA interferase MazF
MNCSRNDVVLLPIPFSDLTSHKVRPAIVVGHAADPRDLFVVPITSRLRQATFPLSNWKACGLNVPSAVKGQLATVEIRLVRQITGHLSPSDVAVLDRHLRAWLALEN